MNKVILLSVLFVIAGISSCSSSKKTMQDALFTTTWELEYLSGPRIAFEGLYPDRKPKIAFNETSKMVEGTTSCNGYAAEYSLDGNSISFGEPGPATLMYCGEGETFFLNTIKKVNGYMIDTDGKLNLMLDDIPYDAVQKSRLDNMKKYFALLFICSLLGACNQEKKDTKQAVSGDAVTDTQMGEKSGRATASTYFKATGTEPFWGLDISEGKISLTTVEDSIVVPHTEPIKAMDANVKRYRLQTESTEMTIQIQQLQCTNAMSGKTSPYTASIRYKRNRQKNFTELEGCGDYITDYRLHDIWVLEQLNGKDITIDDFGKEYPNMEINSTTNTFSGFAGCNRMNGMLLNEREILRFTNVATTKMMCEPSNREAEFLSALQSTNTYTIENNRLGLSNADGESIVFKKID